MATAPPPRSTTPSIGVVANDLGVSRKCWNKSKSEAIFSLFTPFVLSLAAGNLRLDTFRCYISQDVHFLKAFAHALVKSLCYSFVLFDLVIMRVMREIDFFLYCLL